MTNMERYPNTKDALNAWSNYGSAACVESSFTDWLLQEYEEPESPKKPQTLAEAAENLLDAWLSDVDIAPEYIPRLRAALKRERKKPVRNCDRYATAKEACAAFNSMCDARANCSGCPARNLKNRTGHCEIDWLYSELSAEE